MTEARQNHVLQLIYLIFDALVSPKMSREQFDRFMSGIGPAQQDRVAEAYTRACGEVPEPSADFLPQLSTPDGEG